MRVFQPVLADDGLLLPSDPDVRAVARRILDEVRTAPIVSPHGHLDAAALEGDRLLDDPATALISGDHYVTRLLHASGVSLDRLGVDPSTTGASPESVWALLWSHWSAFEGTATGMWLELQLRELFSLTLDDARRDGSYELARDRLASSGQGIGAMLERHRVRVLATTDDPGADLSAHRRLSDLAAFPTRVVPTLRPDRLIDPRTAGWAGLVEDFVGATGGATRFESLRSALAAERRRFLAAGATSVDLGIERPVAVDVDDATMQQLHERCLSGRATVGEMALYTAGMVFDQARMSVADGLVLTIHAGVLRGHHRPTTERFGPDMGNDMPLAVSFTEGLRPLLDAFGTVPDFHLVLFTVDETAWSRDLIPLAGFYPAVFVGAPWWFLDTPDGLRRFRRSLTEGAGFTRYSGFIDDARTVASVPVRHATARRVDAGFLASYAVEGRISEDRAIEIAVDAAVAQPERVFKLR